LLQLIQTRQTSPVPEGDKKEKKKFREYFTDAAAGKDVNESEMSARVMSNMMYVMPLMTVFIAWKLPGAVVLYYATQAGVAAIQQKILLHKDYDEIKEITAKRTDRELKAKEAKIVSGDKVKKRSAKKGGTTVVRRVSTKKK
jgi:membrane protein insertase Oxa1/YidC/SpoIIIJ